MGTEPVNKGCDTDTAEFLPTCPDPLQIRSRVAAEAPLPPAQVAAEVKAQMCPDKRQIQALSVQMGPAGVIHLLL